MSRFGSRARILGLVLLAACAIVAVSATPARADPPSTITLGVDSAVGAVGSTVTFTAKITDDLNSPVLGVLVTFETLDFGPRAGNSAIALSTANGEAVWSYSAATPGPDSVRARFVSPDGATHYSNWVNRDWLLVTGSITLAVNQPTGPVGTWAWFLATVTDGSGQPMPWVWVSSECIASPGGVGGGGGSSYTLPDSKQMQTGFLTSTPGTYSWQASFKTADGVTHYSNVVTHEWQLTPSTWSTTGSLSDARRYHTATLLKDGRVLVTGGSGTGNPLDLVLPSAELYDPLWGTWSNAPDMGTARTGHTATLLKNGKVLVAGGDRPGGSVASAELYDPATGTWSPTGSMGTPRAEHTAVLLSDGKVLVAGGHLETDPWTITLLDSAELYDPVAGTWSPTGTMISELVGHTATLLPNGKVLVAGGYDSASMQAAAELYDPVAGTWSSTGSMTSSRLGHTATLLPSGKVLVAGGHSGVPPLATELYDPEAGTWSPAGLINTDREAHTATLLPSGKVLVAGGEDHSAYLAAAEVYDPATGTWSWTGSMAATRKSHTATLLSNGDVLVVGGLVRDFSLVPTSSAELYQPAGPNQPPVAGIDSWWTNKDIPAIIPLSYLLTNDTDPENDPLTILDVGCSIHGTAVMVGSNVVFTPDPGYTGDLASAKYTLADGHGNIATGYIGIRVLEPNQTMPPPGGGPVVLPGGAGTVELPADAPAGAVLTVNQVSPQDQKGPPSGFKVGAKGYYEITMEPPYTGSGTIKVTLHYDDTGMTLAQEKNLKLFHWKDPSGWEDITWKDPSNPDTTKNLIIGYTDSFSDFGAFAPDEKPVISVSPTQQTVQYSDLSAEIHVSAYDNDGPVLWLTDSGLPADIVKTDEKVATWPSGRLEHDCWYQGRVMVPKNDYPVTFAASDGIMTASAVHTVTVEPEDAAVTFDPLNPTAAKVARPGGASSDVYFKFNVSEIESNPAMLGDITKAVPAVKLMPIGPGPSVLPLSIVGPDALGDVTVKFTGVPVNSYTLVALIYGGYYAGYGEDAFTVYDPSAGFATGGGWFYWPGTATGSYAGDRTTFGFTTNYTRKLTNFKGNLVVIRHLAGGTIYRMKSSAVSGLAVGQKTDASGAFGWASFTGKATYLEPGWPSPVGDYAFSLYAEDRNEPGVGTDRFWIRVTSAKTGAATALAMDPTGYGKAVPINGGNIAIPRKAAAP